jgi:tetratricopeptide (TPR) repeat protein
VIKRAWPYQTEAWLGCALVILTLAVYWPVTHAEFLVYDDPTYVTDNLQVQRGLTAESVAWAFGRSQHSNWHPLTWLSLMLDAEWFGLDAGAFHRTNLFFHAVNALLLFWVLRRMTGAVWRSALVAALFAWHPLHVESVAWVTERKDVLSTCFGWLTFWAYLRYAEGGGKRFYGLALLCFGLGLMAKSMLVTWPFVLLLLDLWPLRRLPGQTTKTPGEPPRESPFGSPALGQLWREKIPFFGLSFLAGLAAYGAQTAGGSVASGESLPLPLRVANALVAYATYLRKMVWPNDLTVFYPHPGSWPWLQVALALCVLIALSVWVWRAGRRYPYLLVGWLWYLGTLVPVIGLVQIGKQSMADRYTYVPLVGVYLMVVWGLTELWVHWRLPRIAAASLAGVALIACLVGTARQVNYWVSNESLFRHALRVTRNNPVAHHCLGCTLARQNRFGEAIREFNHALRIRPDYPEAHCNLGIVLVKEGKPAEAKVHYEAALRYRTNYSDAWYNLGNILAKEDRLEAAREHYLQALQFKPELADAHNNLGVVLAAQRKLPEAIEHYEIALRLQPDLADAHNNLAVALESLGKNEEATKHLRAAVKLNPAQADAHSNLGWLLARQGKLEEASGQFRVALQFKPGDAQSHFRLGAILASQQKTGEAIGHFREALRARPDWPTALNALAGVLATHPNGQFRDGTEAVRLAERSCALTGEKNAVFLETLAAAYAEAGRFDQALATLARIHALPSSSVPAALQEKLAQRELLYQAGKPFHQTP